MNARNSLKIFFLYMGLLMAPGVALHWVGMVKFDALPPSFFTRALWLVIVLGLVSALYHVRVRLLGVVRANPFFWALLGIAALSVFWSVNAMVSLKGIVALGSMFLIGTALARTVTLDTGIGVLHAALATLVVGSALVVWYAPEIGIHARWVAAPWKGVFWQKNGLGNAAALWGGLCLAVALSARHLSGVLGALAGIVVAVLVTWKSGSVTAYFGFFASVVVLLALFSVQRGWVKAWQLAVLAGVGLLFLALFYGELFNLFGRNESLTGRWSMWKTLWPIMLDRPFLGYGYGAYTHAEGVAEQLGRWKSTLIGGGHPHNAFVKVQLDVGLGGVILALGMMVHLSARVMGWIRRREFDRYRYIATGFWVVIFLHQIAEPSMFMPLSLSVVLLVYTSLLTYTPAASKTS